MSEGYTAALVAFGIVFIIGFILPLCLVGFIPDTNEDMAGVVNKIGNETDGRLFPNPVSSFFSTQIAVFKYLPSSVSIPLLIIVLVSIIYAVVKLLLP